MSLGYSERGSRLLRRRHFGPLYLQKPFCKACAHLYLLHPPGGIVSGDTLRVSIDVGERAHALVTTPGASRMYRARATQPTQQQIIRLSLQPNVCLEWFPMEAIVYHGASTALQTTIDLSAGSKFSGWEITCFGLPASGQLFESGSFQQSYRIEREGTPIFIDRLQVNATDHALLKGFADMQGFTVSGFIIAGSFEDILLETLIDSLREKVHGLNIQKTVSITQLEDFLVVRYLGDSAFQC